MLAGEVLTGVPLLRELGFLPGGDLGPQNRVCDDPTCLEMLQEDLDEGRTWLLLFPALFMAVTLFCFNFIGDGLRDALDPKDR